MGKWFDRNSEIILFVCMLIALMMPPIIIGIVANTVGTMALDAVIHLSGEKEEE